MNSKSVPLEFANKLISAVASDKGGRRVSKLCRPEHLVEAAEKLARLSRVVIISGFFVPSAGAPETDGPGGAAIIARAFMEQGVETEIWTDPFCVDAIRACALAIGISPETVKIPEDYKSLDSFSPEGIIFIERLGRAADGNYYNMRKKDISRWTPSLDGIAIACAGKGIFTVGIGDGGNEVGMGNFIVELQEMMPEYKACLSVIGTDVAIPVDVSNWGSYALTAELSHIWGVWRGHRCGEEGAMLEALKNCGSVDGKNLDTDLSVDGFPLCVQELVVSELYDIWEEFNR